MPLANNSRTACCGSVCEGAIYAAGGSLSRFIATPALLGPRSTREKREGPTADGGRISIVQGTAGGSLRQDVVYPTTTLMSFNMQH